MRILSKTLTIIAPNGTEVHFRSLQTKEERQEAYRLRHEIFVRRMKFVSARECPSDFEYDEYDAEGLSTQFGAFMGGKLVGTVRAIHCPKLPTFKNFEFATPRPLRDAGRERTFEISRLAALTTRELGVPRATLLTGLLYALMTWSAGRGYMGGYGFMVEKSLSSLEKWGAPVRRVRSFRHVQDSESERGRLFEDYNPEVGEVTPVWFFLPSVLSYLRCLLFGTRSFQDAGSPGDGRVKITGSLPSVRDKLRLYLCCWDWRIIKGIVSPRVVCANRF